MGADTPEHHIHHTLENIKREYENAPGLAATNAMLHHCAFLAAKIAERSEKTSRRIVRLTWALVVLTVALLCFTTYLSFDVYLKSRHGEMQTPEKAK
jgi:cytochrome bd-type quinol oxidase subunit 2